MYSVVWKERGFFLREHAELVSGVDETIGNRKVKTLEGSLVGLQYPPRFPVIPRREWLMPVSVGVLLPTPKTGFYLCNFFFFFFMHVPVCS